MLQELAITDFAIIQAVRLRFANNLVIFTGETGAGKSIVLDAIGALLGERMGADVVRAGAARAVVEGIFALDGFSAPDQPNSAGQAREGQSTHAGQTREGLNPLARKTNPSGLGTAGEHTDGETNGAIHALLQEYGLEGDEDALIITREIAATGRSVARVNGRAVPISVLAQLGALLVDVHGQGAHLSLLHADQHIDFLDRYAETLPEREALAGQVRAWQALKREAATLRRDERELERRAELLRYQTEEITAADLHPGEMAELEQERTVLANAERLGEMAVQAYAALAGAEDGEQPGVLDLLNQTHRTLADLARIDGSLAESLTIFDESRYQLEDVAATLRAYRDRVEADPTRLAAIEERLDRITRLRRKYGATIEDILAYGAEAAEELAQIDHRDERIAELDTQIARLRVSLGQQAAALSQRRQAAAGAMSAEMEAALDRLNMRQAKFQVRFEHKPDADGVAPVGPTPNPSPPLVEREINGTKVERGTGFTAGETFSPSPATLGRGPGGEAVAITPTGIDRVEFLIAPNPGEPPKPLAKIASGGETARLMLALKTILAHADATPTLIFDEIDAGISGLTGQIVGEMLWQLARGHQVICVTHLPQMAAFGDQHWHVAKRIVGDRTTTVVTDLDAAARTLEVAQMLGGIATETAARNAAELLDRAATWKAAQPTPATNGHAATKRASKKRVS